MVPGMDVEGWEAGCGTRSTRRVLILNETVSEPIWKVAFEPIVLKNSTVAAMRTA